MNYKILSFTILSAITLSGCVAPDYSNYYKLDEQYLERRQIETRRFETLNEKDLLVASSQVLQDLGYTITEGDMDLGLITASKDRDATNAGQIVGAIFLAAFTGTAMPVDTTQKVHATIVSTKSKTNKGYNVRVEFARVIFNTQGGARIERILDQAIYKEFFDKLSQSVFLTANDL